MPVAQQHNDNSQSQHHNNTTDESSQERGSSITQRAVGDSQAIKLNSSGIPIIHSKKLQQLVQLTAKQQQQQQSHKRQKTHSQDLHCLNVVPTNVPLLDDLTTQLLNDINDDFVQQVSLFAASLAKHRGAQSVDVQDIDLVLRTHYDMIVPASKPVLDASVLKQAKDDALQALQQAQTEARSNAAKAAHAAKHAAASAAAEAEDDGETPAVAPVPAPKSKPEPVFIDPKQVELTTQDLINKALQQSAAQRAVKKPFLSDAHKRRMDLIVRARSQLQILHKHQQQSSDDVIESTQPLPQSSSTASAAVSRPTTSAFNRNKRKRSDSSAQTPTITSKTTPANASIKKVASISEADNDAVQAEAANESQED